jgi:predicted lipoprotein with Yx(FWY)xxD motif
MALSKNKVRIKSKQTIDLEKYIVSELLIFNSLEVGEFLTDNKGISLYMFMNDKPEVSVCNNECADLFPPALLPLNKTVVAPEGLDVSFIGHITRQDGKIQLTYNKFPLYYFSKDTKALQINGHGYDNLWYLMSSTGKPITKVAYEEGMRLNETSRSSRDTSDELTRNITTAEETGLSDCLNLNGFFFKSENMNNQMLLYNYCCLNSKKFYQCILSDMEGRLVGLNYILNATIFNTLPDNEKKLWHSNEFQIKNGLLILVEKNSTKENEYMKMLVDTYGKAISIWDTELMESVPLGTPKLLMTLTKEGEVSQKLLQFRDQLFDVKVQDIINSRKNLKAMNPASGADDWEKSGKTIVFNIEEKPIIGTLSNLTSNTAS